MMFPCRKFILWSKDICVISIEYSSPCLFSSFARTPGYGFKGCGLRSCQRQYFFSQQFLRVFTQPKINNCILYKIQTFCPRNTSSTDQNLAYMPYVRDCPEQSLILILCPGVPENMKLSRKFRK